MPPRLSSKFGPAVTLIAGAALAACATAPTSTAPPAPSVAPSSAPAAGPAPAAAPTRPAGTPAPAAAGATAPNPPGTPPAAAAARPAAPPVPGAPPPFAEVTRGAQSQAGYLPVWTKDDKTWLEIPADRLDKPLYFGSSYASGLGERFFLPGLTGREHVVTFRRVGNVVQLVARNLRVRAPEGSPLARAVAESFSDSLLASAPLAAAPHPERKSLLVDATVLLGGDLAGTQMMLEAAYRVPYALDRANTSIERTRTTADSTAVTIRGHYAVPKLPPPPVFMPGTPPPPPGALPNPPRVVPDPRSLFLSYTYTLAELPAVPMRPRLADQRVGFFTTPFVDLIDESSTLDRRTHLVERWRLEKKDPTAEVSEPKQPIRVVLDRNIPERWRETVKAGVLEWNKAFERAGFRDALAVEQQPADADWTAFEGTRLLAVRWFAMEGPGAVAVGPSQSDPRTGEILRGAAIIPENWVRFDRAYVADVQLAGAAAPGPADAEALPAMRNALGEFAPRFMACTMSAGALEQTAAGLELLTMRGDIQPGSPEAERYIAAALKDVVMHEVGHALGLRHNFRGSNGITSAQLRDARFTAERGISNSVMDYNARNLPLQGEAVTAYHMGTLGAYDHWVIEYGYREFADAATERRELAAIAGRSDRDPALAYATDEDAAGGDPTANLFDLGDDPLGFAQRQMKLARELWERSSRRPLPEDDDMSVLRRNLIRGLNGFAGSVPLLARHIGGQSTSRALAGAGKPVHQPVPQAQQRQALELIVGEVFSSASFRFDPAFMTRLGLPQLDRAIPGQFAADTSFSLASAVLNIQRGALDTLMSEAVAQRLADAEMRVADARGLLSYADVHQRLREAVWSELKADAKAASLDIDSMRRNLQREHVKRLAAGLLRPAPATATDVRAVHRQAAVELEAELRKALALKGWSPIARAHLADSQSVLAEALKAPLTKQGV